MYGEGPSAEDLKKLEESGGYPSDYQKKFMSLYAINSDVAGWLQIEDTQVNYPVVHYTDNDYYLRRDFYRKDNKHGIPWLEANNTLNPQSDNYVVYGHNMTDGQMFGELMKYKPSGEGLEYLKNHAIISFDDVYRDNDYRFSRFLLQTPRKLTVKFSIITRCLTCRTTRISTRLWMGESTFLLHFGCGYSKRGQIPDAFHLLL
jgi:SrtB family sortase